MVSSVYFKRISFDFMVFSFFTVPTIEINVNVLSVHTKKFAVYILPYRYYEVINKLQKYTYTQSFTNIEIFADT